MKQSGSVFRITKRFGYLFRLEAMSALREDDVKLIQQLLGSDIPVLI